MSDAMSGAHRKGWCPSALRPMESGDGLIVRLKIAGGEMSPALATAIAQWAENFGNGQIDLTSRANLQLRGVSERTLPALQAALDAEGLLDADPAAESTRNILSSPLAGIDPDALLDIRPQIRALDEKLRSDRALHDLPPKFLFLTDDGGRLPLPLAVSDVGFVATAVESKPIFAVFLGAACVGACETDALVETAARVATVFLRFRNGETRMAQLIRRMGVEPLARAADLKILSATPLPRAASPHILGPHKLGTRAGLGLGLPFGRIDADALRYLAKTADESYGVLRLSPWRAIFLVAPNISNHVTEKLRDAGFLLADDAPLRAVAACSGKRGCFHGETNARTDATRLASLAQTLGAKGIALHVSACSKGCAHAHQATVTLIGRDGHYDLVLDGRAGDTPLLRGLALPEAERLIASLATIAPAARAAFIRRQLCEAVR